MGPRGQPGCEGGPGEGCARRGQGDRASGCSRTLRVSQVSSLSSHLILTIQTPLLYVATNDEQSNTAILNVSLRLKRDTNGKKSVSSPGAAAGGW